MPYEDFTTYTWNNGHANLARTSTRVTATSLIRNTSQYLYKDKGVNYFNGDFTHLLDVLCSGYATDDWFHLGLLVLANAIADEGDLRTADEDHIYVLFTGTAGGHVELQIREWYDGSEYSDGTAIDLLSLDTVYYLIFERDESIGDHGRLYCYIYSNSARTNLLDTLQLDLHAKLDFRYIYAGQSRTSTSFPNAEISGYLENFELHPYAFVETYTEVLGLKDSVKKKPLVTRIDPLGLKDSLKKHPEVVKTALLGLIDGYSRVWSAHGTYSEALGLTDTYNRVWDIYRTYLELLGLIDTAEKNPSTLKAEALGLIDIHSRVWSIYRTYTELLGLLDTGEKRPLLTRVEYLGLLDTASKDLSKPFFEPLGLLDMIVKESSITRIEFLGLIDTAIKDIDKAFVEYLGLIDFYSRVWDLKRNYMEYLGLKDTSLKEVSKPLTEVLGFMDWLQIRTFIIAATIKLSLARKEHTLTLADKSILLSLAEKLYPLSLADKEALIKLVNKISKLVRK